MLGYAQFFVRGAKGGAKDPGGPAIHGKDHKMQNVFYKGADMFTWFNIIFLPPEAAKRLTSGKVEIKTVSLLD